MNDQTNTESHFKRSYLLIALGVLAIVIGLLMVPIRTPGRNALALGDLVHAPLFGSLTLGLLIGLNFIRPTHDLKALWRRAAVAAITLWIFGVGMESVQWISGRTASLHDAMANGCGIAAAASLYLAWQYHRRRPKLAKHSQLAAILVLVAVTAITRGWWRPVHMFVDAARINNSFPMMASFETEIEFTRWYNDNCELSLSTKDVTDGDYSIEVKFGPTQYPNITITEFVHDWSDVEQFEVDVTLDESYPGESAKFAISVMDIDHGDHDTDVLTRTWKFKPGESKRLTIGRDEILNGPQDREMDLTKMAYVTLLLEDPDQPAVMRFDAMRLRLQQRGERE